MSQNQEPNRETIVILEDDKSILEVLRDPKFAAILKTEGLDAEVLVLETVSQLREKIAQNIKVVCLVTDLGGMGWGSVDGILKFNDEQGIKAPVLIATGTDLFYVIGSSNEDDLSAIGISFLQKPYRFGALATRIKLLIDGAVSR